MSFWFYHDCPVTPARAYPWQCRNLRLIAALAGVAWALALGGCTGALMPPLSPPLSPPLWQPVGPGVWLAAGAAAESDARNGGWTSNLSFVQTGTQGWLVGSGPSAALAAQLQQALWREQGLPITHLLSPRAHPESVLGAAGLPGLPHHALPEVARAMAQRCPACAARLAARVATAGLTRPTPTASTPPLPPIALPSATLASGAGQLQFFALERAPGEWSTAVLQGRTLLAPGLVWGAGLVPELREAQLAPMVAALHRLRALAPSTVVPEQGAAGHGGLIDKDLRYWQGLGALVCAALQTGQSLDEAQARPEWAALLPGTVADTARAAFNTARHALNTQRAWLDVEGALLDQPGQSCAPSASTR